MLSGTELENKRIRSVKMSLRLKRWNVRSSLRNLKNGGGTVEVDVIKPKVGDPILLINPAEVELILEEIKRIETRSVRTRKSQGTVIFLSKTGTSEIQGYGILDCCIDFESQEEWNKLRKYHQVT